MESNGNGRGGLLSAGGVLSIIVGALSVIGGGIMMIVMVSFDILLRLEGLPFVEMEWIEHTLSILPMSLGIGGGILLALGIVAIVGGVSAIRRKSFGLALAGAICAFLPFNLLGLLSIIFVSLGKREF